MKILSLLLSVALMFNAMDSHSAVITVDTTDDEMYYTDGPDGGTKNGRCSLREALWEIKWAGSIEGDCYDNAVGTFRTTLFAAKDGADGIADGTYYAGDEIILQPFNYNITRKRNNHTDNACVALTEKHCNLLYGDLDLDSNIRISVDHRFSTDRAVIKTTLEDEAIFENHKYYYSSTGNYEGAALLENLELTGANFQKEYKTTAPGTAIWSKASLYLYDVKVHNNKTADVPSSAPGSGISIVIDSDIEINEAYIVKSEVSHNHTHNEYGGAIFAITPTKNLSIINTKINNNKNIRGWSADPYDTTYVKGSGIYADELDNLNIIGSSIFSNLIKNSDRLSNSFGAGLYLVGISNASIESSSIFKNKIITENGIDSLNTVWGVGIFNSFDQLSIKNSTISNNFSEGPHETYGNGVLSFSPLILSFNTIAFNGSQPKENFRSFGGQLIMKGNILHGCNVTSSTYTVSHGFNIHQYCNPLVILGDPTDKQLNMNDVIDAALSYNGDVKGTKSHSLFPGSLAVDTVPSHECETIFGTPVLFDQIGAPRTAGFCDAGAIEMYDFTEGGCL